MIDLLKTGLPAAPDVERYVLGSLMLNESSRRLMPMLSGDLFSVDRHRQVLATIAGMWDGGAHIDRITVAHQYAAQYPAQDAISYIAGLDDGLPEIYNLEAYLDVLQEKAMLRKIIHAANGALQVALSQVEPSLSIARRLQNALEPKAEREAAALMDATEIIAAAGGINEFGAPPQPGIPTPFVQLTELTNGFRRGELFVLGANPSMGKTSMAMQCAATAAEWGADTVVFSLEMGREELLRRLACTVAHVNSHLYRRGGLASVDRTKLAAAIQQITEWPLRIAEHGASTVPAMRSMLRRERMLGRDPWFVVVDYLQLMQAVGRGANRHAELSEISRALKLMAREENVSILLLSQVNRSNAKDLRPPGNADLRDSGSIEENADLIGFIWRPEVVVPAERRAEYRGLAQFILSKQRNGPVGTIALQFVHECTRFQENLQNAA